MMEITIRHAQPDDLQSILDIVNHSILHTTANYSYEPQTLETQRQWFLQKKDKQFPVLVATVQNKVVGFGSYGTFREKIGYQYTVEHSVYVTGNHYGKGVGSQIMTELIRIARAQNLQVMIGVIDADNADSIAFHRKFGFVDCGIIRQVGFKFGRWLDAQLMQLVLQ